jgi:glycosyltransferase involved in cell wall biosynthesis
MFDKKHILIIVENLPVPFDRRVWQEATTLKDNGAKVSIICPKMKGYNKSYECINDIEIYRHPLPIEGKGISGYILEYSIALFCEFLLSFKIFIKKRFHIIQGCNPPDLIFFIAFFYKLLGVKFVFDHHDINPELYVAKYNKKGGFYKLLLVAERLTFATANYSIATNESYKEIAIRRGKMLPEKVQVVRSGPKLERLKPGDGNKIYKKGRKFLIGYVGVIGEQEGLDLLLESCKIITKVRNDVQWAIIGDGTELMKIKAKCSEMGLENLVDFYGRVDDLKMVEILNTADICVNPDRPTEMNNLSTMNKIMEYMALKKPIVQFDLKEGRLSAENASLYANNTCTEDFANKIMWLLENEEERIKMGNFGYKKIVDKLAWEHESQNLIQIYQKAFKLN